MDRKKDFDYFKHNEMLLKLAALTKLKSSANFIQVMLYYAWRTFVLFGIWFSFVAILNDTIRNSEKDFSESAFNFLYLGSFSFAFIRACYYYYAHDTTEDFIDEMNKTFKYETKTGFKEKSMARIVYITKWMNIIWFSLTFFIGNGYLVFPFFFGYYKKKILPLPGWYPYNWKISPYYEVTVFMQFFSQILLMIVIDPTDLFYACTCMMVARQFEILGWEIENVVYSNLFRHGISKDIIINFRDEFNDSLFSEDRYKIGNKGNHNKYRGFSEIYNIMESRAFQDDLLNHFHKLVKFHQTLLSLGDTLTSFFSPVSLSFFVFVSICLMALAYTVITTSNVVLMAENAAAGSWLLLDVLFFSYFAELITEKSEDIRTSLYNLPWYYCDQRFKSSFSIMHLRTIRPVVLTVGKFADLGLNMFVWTVKTSYSVTTLFRNVNQSDRI